ncbi:hypothetical protein BHE74_00043248 [Ensete ventricosum]|nr:hypothetical protein BHE74_00043248 [Ensete ventricosum]
MGRWFPSPNKGSGGGGGGWRSTPEVCCVTEVTSSPRLLGVLATSGPPSVKYCDSLGSRGRHDVVRPASARLAQREQLADSDLLAAVVEKFVRELQEALDADIQDRIMKEREMQSYIQEREREVAEREAAWKAELSRREVFLFFRRFPSL